MNNLLKKEWFNRALRTFLQTAAGYLAVNIVAIDWSETNTLKACLIGLCMSAISAGIAAVMNIEHGTSGE